MKRFELIVGIAIFMVVATLSSSVLTYHKHRAYQEKVELQKSVPDKKLPKSLNKDGDLAADEIQENMAGNSEESKKKSINWKKPSESKDYPNLDKYSKAYLKVSIEKQRVYIMSGKKILYTMYASTGSEDSPTPTGVYHIQAEKGDFFYNEESKEGAKYWVSFKEHGVYLFHSVPTDKSGNFIEKEAKQLGKEANSHGCIRLAVPDAKWIYKNVPEGMRVEIQ